MWGKSAGVQPLCSQIAIRSAEKGLFHLDLTIIIIVVNPYSIIIINRVLI